MAYSVHQMERIEHVFKQKGIPAVGKKFMGGYCFFMDDKMIIGIDIDKKTGKDRLMARIGEDAIINALKKEGCRPMDITGRAMKGFAFIDPEGFDLDSDLEHWIQLAINYNPFAKRSKRK